MKTERKITIMAAVTLVVMIILVAIYYQSLVDRHGTVVIPAGGTYLGPNTPK